VSTTAAPDRRQVTRAVVASTVGTSIEWYDFFLYGTAAALIFPKVFFPEQNPLSGLLISFGTQAVGFAARPVGAAIFGHFGDRVGRKATLIATLLLMGLATAVIGILPGYATIGIWGGILLTLLRICQGLGVGGEWGGSVLLSMEWGSNRRRGFVASWPQVGVPVGLILGNGANLIFSAIFGADYLVWAWRIPFLLSLVLVAIGLYIRLGILETPAFARLVEERRVEPQPLLQVIQRNPGEIVLSALLRMSEQAPFYLFTSFVLAYATRDLKLDRTTILFAVLIAAAVSLITLPLAGHVSDIVGRKNMYMAGVVAVGIFAFPYFWLLNTAAVGLVFLAVIVSLITHDMQYGPQSALIAESFTGRLRYSGASLGYQLASVIAGGPAPLIATALLAAYKTWVPIAIYIIFNAVVSLIAVILLPNRQGVDHTVEYDETAEAVRGTSLA
jgi:metabolite-proton symporter